MRLITTVAIVAAIAAAGSGAILYFLPIVSAPLDHTKEVQNVVAINSTLPTNNSGYQQVNVTVNGIKIVADIAASDLQRAKGLAVKNHLDETEGMLFVFSTPGNYAFWMKDMKFPIDIIWIDGNKTVVHIEHSLAPCSPISCPTYLPNSNSLYVLETVAGFAEKYNVTQGTKVEFTL